MDDEQRDAIRRSNQTRSLRCRKCSSMSLREVDGSKCGGMPGIKYDECAACGTCRPKTQKPKREKLKKTSFQEMPEIKFHSLTP